MGLISGKLNAFTNDTLIYEQGDNVTTISYIKEGAVIKEDSHGETTFIAGEFIAVKDLYDGFYRGDYTATKGTCLISLAADSPASLVEFLKANTTLHSSLSYELCVLIVQLYEMYSLLYSDVQDFYSSIIAMHDRYINCCISASISPTEFLEPHNATHYKYSEQPFYKNFLVFNELASSEPKAHTIMKTNGAKFLTIQLELIRDIFTAYDDMIFYLKTIIALFASKSEYCLFSLTAKLADKASSKYKSTILELLTDMKNIITNTDKDLRDNAGIDIDIDYNRVNFYFLMVEAMEDSAPGESTDDNSDNALKSSPSKSTTKETLETKEDAQENDFFIDYNDTLRKLCQFAGFDDSKYTIYDNAIQHFISLPDKDSREDDVRKFRKEFTLIFYELYEEVFINYANSSDRTELRLVELFLDFGFMDERLLTDSQIEFLISIPELNTVSPCNVYRMKDWLMRIYEGLEITSKNEFDMNYNDFIRERKKNEPITIQKEQELLANSELKARFEIQNLLKYNSRLLNGSILSFFPMLHMDAFERDIKNMLLTSEDINEVVRGLTAIDYSVFYRELLISDEAKKIPRATVQKEIYPNFILFPVAGVNGIMWQETSGNRVNSEGRFLLPTLFTGKLEDTILTMMGRFRWEMCKTLYGSAWNNIQVPSLTSEYCDYVQFYRKNKDLSTEKKEALKNQISRCRNNMREIFVFDYIIWVRFESAGAIRLNKVSRRILASYCPFSKDIRNKIAGQPIFDDAMTKFAREKQRKIKEVNNMIIALERGGATIIDDIKNTKKFYEEL